MVLLFKYVAAHGPTTSQHYSKSQNIMFDEGSTLADGQSMKMTIERPDHLKDVLTCFF